MEPLRAISATVAALALGAAVLAQVGSARAQTSEPPAARPRLDLAWTAPAGACPERAEVLAHVARLLGERAAPASRAVLRVAARVRRAPAGWRLELRTLRGDSAGERAVEVATCRAAARAAALIVAILIDPAAASMALDAAGASTTTPPAPVPGPVEPIAIEALAPRSLRDDGDGDDRVEVRWLAALSVRARAPRDDDDEPPPPRPAPDGRRPATRGAAPPGGNRRALVGGIVAVALAFDTSILPSPAWGLRGAAALRVGVLRLEGAVTYWPTQRATLATRPTAGGTFDLITGTVGAALEFLLGPFALGPALALEAGATRAAGFGVAIPVQQVEPWVALLGGAAAVWRVRDPLALRLTADLVVPLLQSDFVLDAIGSVHRTPPVAFRATLGGEVRF